MAALNHLHLHVRDVGRARRFYERWFGFREQAQHGDILFLRDEAGLDLALAPDDAPKPLPAWFHFGFRLPRPEDVASLHRRMARADVAGLGALSKDEGFHVFRVRDPDAHVVEIYWEA
jgi:catechol 2,3-dioxygenase-like lactoylglutathione lyase family enzyme